MGDLLDTGTRVGITGSRGVLGVQLAHACRDRGLRVVPFKGDVRDWQAADAFAAQVDVLLHAAALVPVRRVASNPDLAVSVNVSGTATIARAAANHGRRLAYVSTSHVYAPSSDALTEESRLDPSSLYGLSKMHGEAWCEALSTDLLIARVFSFFDAAQPVDFLVPSLIHRIRAAEAGATIVLDGATNRRDFADATWVARAVIDLLSSKASGVFNCGTGRGTTVLDLGEALARHLGRPDVVFAPSDAVGDSHIVADTSKLRSQLPLLEGFVLERSLEVMLGGR